MNLPPIADLKRQAKKMKNDWDGEFSQAECLNVVAQDHGFKDWQELAAKHPELTNRQKWFEQQAHRRDSVIIERKP